MDKLKLIDKLREKADISYEEARHALEKADWDILEAMLYLEECGIVEKPSVGVFYTNELNESYNDHREVINIKENSQGNNYKNKNSFEGIFEAICKTIDNCNNIFLSIKRKNKVFLKIPITVLIILLFFTFWVTIPGIIIALFFDIEFFVHSNRINTDNLEKINNVLNQMSRGVRDFKEKL